MSRLRAEEWSDEFLLYRPMIRATADAGSALTSVQRAGTSLLRRVE